MTRKWIEVSRTAALSGLYLRAARKRKISGDSLPSSGLRCQLSVDPQQLQAYRKLCHFSDDGHLPPTFPHVMAFALQMQLLTAADFPFPLLGLVHLHNRIRVLRPLGGISRLRLRVHVDNLQAHEKGATCDLITEAEDGLGLLWSETSRMLCRGLKLAGEPTAVEAPEALPLSELTRWYADSDIGRRYAKVCGDYNPIHLSAASARLFGFPTAIAHGMWSKAMALAALRGHLPVSGYEIEVGFVKPVRLPSEVILNASPAAAEGQLRLDGHGELVHMRGAWRPLS
ncbi:MaoC family dehydratase [Pseudomonas rubra]|uniref:Acyl dehydratase n=1 Tax=Pseudomonas rubra TaxID=2942627 RepID=A0ABT5P3N6_9PSED|nr:MaoC/PaaZ C-terminal domain-containing protein [Pseudomonas rubra]MDD1012898.1 acyl dehydratase [Pseudomonas rubra]MDD1038234.1 acyl dehydratase [Pseudomonas rubra]MDD1156687.1 acyl dehydratase [Pseudomonas rubra]